ncbi:hypothetical protein Amal_03606 [Acetobacter malorum]|uniref:Uncharacterized protein n=1 Tax=Acetobacter malorum TaxID=178901 RepID=A0A177G4E3_9PROT|nr:hypothetical protein Amal_03606 [Acetobacter malorum]
MPSVAARNVMIGLVTGSVAQRVIVHRKIVKTHVCKPVHHVTPAIETRDTRGGADTKMNLAFFKKQILDNLRARLATSHNQHSPFRQLGCIAVILRVNLKN